MKLNRFPDLARARRQGKARIGSSRLRPLLESKPRDTRVQGSKAIRSPGKDSIPLERCRGRIGSEGS